MELGDSKLSGTKDRLMSCDYSLTEAPNPPTVLVDHESKSALKTLQLSPKASISRP